MMLGLGGPSRNHDRRQRIGSLIRDGRDQPAATGLTRLHELDTYAMPPVR